VVFSLSPGIELAVGIAFLGLGIGARYYPTIQIAIYFIRIEYRAHIDRSEGFRVLP
jgi:hypothetical protein